MKMQELKRRRLANPRIETDSEGNLILPEIANRVSGKKQREKANLGVFFKKDENHEISNKRGTYRSYNFGDPMPEDTNADEKVED